MEIRTTPPTTERLFWHCGAHTAEPKVGPYGPIPYDRYLLISVARGSTLNRQNESGSIFFLAPHLSCTGEATAKTVLTVGSPHCIYGLAPGEIWTCGFVLSVGSGAASPWGGIRFTGVSAAESADARPTFKMSRPQPPVSRFPDR